MRSVAGSALLIAFAIVASSPAEAAPQSLYGKSIAVTWQEERQQRVADEAQLRSVAAAGELDVYVSDAGRPFSRLRMSVVNRRGKLKSGNRDAVGGEDASRNISFSGSTMTASMKRGAGGALLVSVTFDNGFQSCSAHAINGKASGVQVARGTSMISGKSVEFYSIKTSGESCRIQTGNIFAN